MHADTPIFDRPLNEGEVVVLWERELRLEAGSLADYGELAEFHYLARRPATVTRVLRLSWERATVVGRYLGRKGEKQVVGVLVESMPTLQCRMRDWALGGRYAELGEEDRVRAINAEVRCLSRVVVRPEWRGLGLAVRLVRAGLDSARTVVTEAMASMGEVHPFFEKAGMRAYRRPAHAFDQRLIDAMGRVGLCVEELVLGGEAVERLGEDEKRWFVGELRRWYRRGRGRGGGDEAGVGEMIEAARGRVLTRPVYYVAVRGRDPGPGGPGLWKITQA